MPFLGSSTGFTNEPMFQQEFVLQSLLKKDMPAQGMLLREWLVVQSDVIDYDEFLNKSRSEASFAVFSTLIPKFVAIPASAVPLAVINLLGFVQPIAGVAQAQNDTVKRFIKVTFVMLPFSCAVMSFCLKFLYPIKTNETAKLVHQGIKKFRTGCKRVYDPILNEVRRLLWHAPSSDVHTYPKCFRLYHWH